MTKNPEENPLEKDREPEQTQSSNGNNQDMNAGHLSGRRLLSPFRHPSRLQGEGGGHNSWHSRLVSHPGINHDQQDVTNENRCLPVGIHGKDRGVQLDKSVVSQVQGPKRLELKNVTVDHNAMLLTKFSF